MKKVAGAILIVLMALLVSCSMDTEDPSSRGAYVTFGQSQSVGSRSLDTSYDVVGYDELYWFYDAVKKDNYGTTGAGAGQKIPGDAYGKGTAGTVGPFSQGEWEFKLYAYSSASNETGSWVANENSLVYASEAIAVRLRGGETKNIAVSVTPQGDTGTVAFQTADGSKYAYFKWKDGGTDAPVVTFHLDGSKDVNDFTTKVTLGTKDESSGEYKLVGPLSVNILEESTTAIPVDFYNCTVTVSIPDYEDTPLYTQSFSLSVFGGQTTIITGDITENVDSEVSFDVMDSELVVFQSSGSASSSVTPSGNEGATTTVDFSSANLDSGSTYYLTVGAAGSSAQNNDGFVVSEGEYVVGSIDLSLIAVSVEDGTTVQTPVTSFDGDAVTVTTYIEAGLPEVSLQYVGEGDDPTLISYDSTTGELKFSTTHFSTFIVVADAVAMNMDTGMCYGALNTAFNEAGDGDSIKLLADVEVGDANTEGAYIVILNKELSFDLAGHVITVADDYKWSGGVIEIKQGGSLTIDDSSTEQTGGINVVKEPVDFSNLVYDCVVLFPDVNSGEGASLIINGGNYTSTVYTISGNGSITENEKTYIEINGGNFYSTDSQNIYHPQIGTLVVNGGTFNALEAAIEVRAGDVTINGGSFTARRETGAYCNPSNSGDTTGGAAIAIAQHTTQFPINVVINNGSFKGYYALHQKNVQNNPQEAVDKISIEVNGGDFSTLGKGTVPVYSENISGFIHGGTFSHKPDASYIAAGFDAEEVDGQWVVDTIFEDGKGTADEPFIIVDESQFAKISTMKDAMKKIGNYYYFSIEDDLDFLDGLYNPYIEVFRGDLDFNGHSLSGVSPELLSELNGTSVVTLIDTIAEGAIRNLVYLPADQLNLVYCAVWQNVHEHDSVNGAKILLENITAGQPDIKQSFGNVGNNAGFFVIQSFGPNTELTFRNCTNYYDLDYAAGTYAGIFLSGYGTGDVDVIFENCDNYGTIYAPKFGYLIGNDTDTSTSISAKDCNNYGAIYVTEKASFIGWDAAKYEGRYHDLDGNEAGTIKVLDAVDATVSVSENDTFSISGVDTGKYSSFEVDASGYGRMMMDGKENGTLLLHVSTGIQPIDQLDDLSFRALPFIDSSYASGSTSTDDAYGNSIVTVGGEDFYSYDLASIEMSPGLTVVFPTKDHTLRGITYNLYVYDSDGNLAGSMRLSVD